MMYLYGYICYLKPFDRTWELSLYGCYLNYIILCLFMRFKTHNLGQINKFMLFFFLKLKQLICFAKLSVH